MTLNTNYCGLLLLLACCFIILSCSSNSSAPEETVSLQTTITPANAGSVSPSQGEYNPGDQVQLTASPNQNWIFKEWNGDHTGTTNPASITINQNMNIQALFEQLMFPLTVVTEGEGSVSEAIVNPKTDYVAGTMVELTAQPADEWNFGGWSGHLEGDENPAIITIDAAKEVTAHFTFGFDEHFEQEEPDNWVFSDSRFSIEDGHLQFISGRDQGWGGAYFDQFFTDFKIEARVARLESQGSINHSMAFFIRATGSRAETAPSGYLFPIAQNGHGSAWKVENGITTNLIPWVPIAQLNSGLGNFNTIAVNVKGTRFDLFANGEHLIGFTDSSYEGGFAGLAAATDTPSGSTNGDHVVLWDYVKLTPAENMSGKQGALKFNLPESGSMVPGGNSGYHIPKIEE